MKRIVLAGVSLLFLSASQLFAQVESELFLNNGITTCTIDVTTALTILTTGDCGSFIITAPTVPHGTLVVDNSASASTFGGFTLTDTGKGGGATVRPLLQSFNDVDVKNTGGSGTLTALYTDTGYTDVATHFFISVTTNSQQLAGTADYTGLVDATNSIPATTPIGSFLNQSGPASSTFGTFPNPIYPTTPYSLTSQIVVNFTKKGEVDANYQISAVPEGAAVPLFGGLALVACGLMMRRKRSIEA